MRRTVVRETDTMRAPWNPSSITALWYWRVQENISQCVPTTVVLYARLLPLAYKQESRLHELLTSLTRARLLGAVVALDPRSVCALVWWSEAAYALRSACPRQLCWGYTYTTCIKFIIGNFTIFKTYRSELTHSLLVILYHQFPDGFLKFKDKIYKSDANGCIFFFIAVLIRFYSKVNFGIFWSRGQTVSFSI